MSCHAKASPGAFVLHQERDLPSSWCNYFVEPGERPLHVLASALVQGPSWGEHERVALVLREAPEPALVLIGFFSERGAERARVLQRNLPQALARLRYVSYRQAEEDCERLAAGLVDALGRDTLARCSYVGIPRGGLIVLGLLSYALDLEPRQLRPSPVSGVPLVVVDDCALTGYRFGHFASELGDTDLVFAHLYSPPGVRARIVREVPRVLACCAAHDLEEREGVPEALWEGRRFGPGTAHPLAFAWGEPDMVVRDEGEGVTRGWRLVPPSHVLNARVAPRSALPVQVQAPPPAGAELRPAPTVVYARFGSEVVLADLDTGKGFGLDGAAANLWLAIAERGTIEDAVSAASRGYDVDEQQIRRDVRDFVDELREAGLLEAGGGGVGGGDGNS